MNSNETPLIIKKSKRGSDYADIPNLDVPDLNIREYIDNGLLRKSSPELPDVSEPEVVRHYIKLSLKNHHVDKDFYPLGSCTMKYNPKINDKIASDPMFANIHPNQDSLSVQGHLKLQYDLEAMLNNITGMNATTLQPSAGSQGEFVGLLIMQKYHKSKKNKKRYIIIPESAHGTNPASVVLAGFEVVQVGTNSKGCLDIDDLKDKMNDEVAGMMLTQPNTLGIFEEDIAEIAKIIHGVDGLLYMDGANLNAMLGISRPIDMGFDIVHMNLHKTFSTPHGGGGPGSGPIGVVEKLKKYLPTPVVRKDKDSYFLNYDMKDSIGRIHSFYGNVGVLVRAYCYIKTLGSKGLEDVGKNAIINANYIKKRLSSSYSVPYSRGTMHEFVISAQNQKERGLKALDIAKIILDHGFHAPTIYFPINVKESIMIEPTETESKETLDSFIDLMLNIDSNLEQDIGHFLDAPVNTPVRRLNETKANRELNLSWKDEL
tara:strand:+ start:457 stop:1917 length:1461 start_codon:yes stop_codon:yes gene_type:complete